MESPIASVRVLDVRHLSQTTLYLSVPFTYSSFSGCALQSNDLRVSLALVANRRIRVMCRQRADRLMMMSLRRPKRGRFHMVKCVRHWYRSRMFGVGYDARKWRGSSTRLIFDHRATAAATAPVGVRSRSECGRAMARWRRLFADLGYPVAPMPAQHTRSARPILDFRHLRAATVGCRVNAIVTRVGARPIC